MILNQNSDCRDNHPYTSNDMEKVLELQNSVMMRRRMPTYPYPDFGYRPHNLFPDEPEPTPNVLEQQKLIQNLLKHYQNTLIDETQWLNAGGLLNGGYPKRYEDEEVRMEEGRKRKREEEGKVFTKQRKTNFTAKEVETLLNCVADRKDVILFGVAGGKGWAKAWQEIAKVVSKVEGIDRTEGDVRKKWTYLKWEAKNTSKPGRDPVSKQVLNILTSRDREVAEAMSLRESLDPFPTAEGAPIGESPSPMGQSPATPPVQAQKEVPPALHIKKQPPLLTPKPPHVKEGMKTPVKAPPKPQPPPEVCLRWNSYHSNMQNTFPSLLNNEQFVDVTLACDGRSIKCHKVMLSACSPYMEELLSSNPCQHPIIFLKDMKFWQLAALVDFMYRGEVNVTQDKLPSLLSAAEALQIKGLASPVHPSSPPPQLHGTDSSESTSYHHQFKPEMKIETEEDSYMQDTDDEQAPPVQRPKKRKISDTASSSGRMSTPSTNVNGKKHREHREKEAPNFTPTSSHQSVSLRPSQVSTTSRQTSDTDRDNGYKEYQEQMRNSHEDLNIDEEQAQYILQQYAQTNASYAAEEEDDDRSNGSG